MDVKAVCIINHCPYCMYTNLNYMVSACCTKTEHWGNDITTIPKDCLYKKEIKEYKHRMKNKKK